MQLVDEHTRSKVESMLLRGDADRPSLLGATVEIDGRVACVDRDFSDAVRVVYADDDSSELVSDVARIKLLHLKGSLSEMTRGYL